MSDLRKAAQAVIQAWDDPAGTTGVCCALDALRAALAGPEPKPKPEPEPVAWHYTNNGGGSAMHWGLSAKLDADIQAAKDYPRVHKVTPLYAIPMVPPKLNEPCRYPDCVDNGPDGKCTRWLMAECEKSEDYRGEQ